MRDKTLAILGGIGAAASCHMAMRLVEECQKRGARTDADFPDFVLYNLPSEATSEHGIENAQLVLGELAIALKKFNVWGCDYLLLACNTIHYYMPEMKDRFGGAIINMVELAAAETKGTKKVGVLCSRSSRESGIYRRALDHHGIEAIYPTDESQVFLDRAINDAISGSQPGRNWKGIHGIDLQLRSHGAGRVILGCTELPLCLKGHPLADHVVDAGEVAVSHALALLSSGAPETA